MDLSFLSRHNLNKRLKCLDWGCLNSWETLKKNNIWSHFISRRKLLSLDPSSRAGDFILADSHFESCVLRKWPSRGSFARWSTCWRMQVLVRARCFLLRGPSGLASPHLLSSHPALSVAFSTNRAGEAWRPRWRMSSLLCFCNDACSLQVAIKGLHK